MGAAHENLRGGLPRDIIQQVRGDIGKVRIKVGVVCRDTHAIGADQARCRFDLGLTAFDRRPAVALKVLLRREREIRRMGVMVLRIVPFDAREASPPIFSTGFV